MIVLNTSQLSNDVKYVSERCREFRKKANKSQYDLSDITGLSPNTIARLENDQRIPDLEQIFRYCYALNVPVTDFYRSASSPSVQLTNPSPLDRRIAVCQMQIKNLFLPQ